MTEIQPENASQEISETSSLNAAQDENAAAQSQPQHYKNSNCNQYVSKHFCYAMMITVIISLIISVGIEVYSIYQKNIYFSKQKQELAVLLSNITKDSAKQQKEILALQNTNKILTNDITAIKVSQQRYGEELIIQVKNLNQQIDALAIDFILDNKVKTENTNNPLCAQQNLDGYLHLQCILNSTINALQNIVIISHKKTVQTALAPEQLTSIKLNLKTQLLEVEWAIINQQTKLYQSALQQMINSLNIYFANNNQVKNNLVSALQKMQQIDITKPLNIDKSLMAVERK